MADYEFIQETGVVVADTGDLLTDVENEYKEVFGSDLITDPATPQGVMIVGETEARDAVAKNNAALANQFNPNYSGGVFLDALMALTGSARDAATRSTIEGVTLTGIPNTLIPAGRRAQTANREVFELITSVVLDVAGNGTGTFRAVEYGPLSVAPGALNEILDNVLGWETVTNPNASTPGRLKQSDYSARRKRRNTLALQGQSLAEAITSALYDVEGVLSLKFRENVAATTETIDGVSMLPKSIFVCIDGGADLDIATAILEKKSGGCNYNGTTTVDVVEPASGQTYPVKFKRPDEVDILARVWVRNVGSLTNPEDAVKDAILAYAAGLQDGEEGFVVGASVTVFELGGAVGRAAPGLYVQNVQISTDGLDWTQTEIVISIEQVARIIRSSITVNIVP